MSPSVIVLLLLLVHRPSLLPLSQLLLLRPSLLLTSCQCLAIPHSRCEYHFAEQPELFVSLVLSLLFHGQVPLLLLAVHQSLELLGVFDFHPFSHPLFFLQPLLFPPLLPLLLILSYLLVNLLQLVYHWYHHFPWLHLHWLQSLELLPLFLLEFLFTLF